MFERALRVMGLLDPSGATREYTVYQRCYEQLQNVFGVRVPSVDISTLIVSSNEAERRMHAWANVTTAEAEACFERNAGCGTVLQRACATRGVLDFPPRSLGQLFLRWMVAYSVVDVRKGDVSSRISRRLSLLGDTSNVPTPKPSSPVESFAKGLMGRAVANGPVSGTAMFDMVKTATSLLSMFGQQSGEGKYKHRRRLDMFGNQAAALRSIATLYGWIGSFA